VNISRAKLLLRATAAVLFTAGVGAVVAAVMWPMPDLREASQSAAAADASQSAVAGDAVPLATLAPAWSVDLRRPLVDTPHPAAAGAVEQQPSAANLPVRLVGTIVDPTRPRGIFVTMLGQMELRAVGEKAGGAEVLRIDESSATLSVAGQPVTIKLERLEATLPGVDPAVQPPPSARLDETPPAGSELR
jgi:hypothetical protein